MVILEKLYLPPCMLPIFKDFNDEFYGDVKMWDFFYTM